MTPFLAAVTALNPGGGSGAAAAGIPHPMPRPMHILAALLLAPAAVAIIWPVCWAICELHKLLHS